MQKVARYIEQKFNITCATIAVHRDEGHYKNDKPQYNFHAHITFVTVKDGQQNWRQEKIKPADLRELQTAVAEILQMERGEIREKSERITSLNHRQYREVARQKEKLVNELEQKHNQEIQELKAEILTLKERNAILEQARKDSKGKGFLKSFFDMLSSIKKSEQQYTQEQLLAEIERLKELDKQRREENERLQRQQEQQAQLAAKAAELEQRLEQQNKTIKDQEAQILELKAENNELKSFIKHAFEYVRNNAKNIFDFVKNIFSNELTEPLLNEKEKDEDFIAQIEKTQQRSNLTPLQPENHQEQKQDEQEQQSDEEKPRTFKARRQ